MCFCTLQMQLREFWMPPPWMVENLAPGVRLLEVERIVWSSLPPSWFSDGIIEAQGGQGTFPGTHRQLICCLDHPSAFHSNALWSATSFLSTSFIKTALPPAFSASLLTVRTVIHGPGTLGGCILGNVVTVSKGGAGTESGVSKSTQVITWSCFSVILYSSKYTGRRATASVSNRASHLNDKCTPGRFSWSCSRIVYFIFCRSNFRIYSHFGVW